MKSVTSCGHWCLISYLLTSLGKNKEDYKYMGIQNWQLWKPRENIFILIGPIYRIEGKSDMVILDQPGSAYMSSQAANCGTGAHNFNLKVFFCFFFKNFVGHMSICWATDTPVLDFWWCLLWVSKPEWVLPYSHLAEAYVIYVPWDSPLVRHLLLVYTASIAVSRLPHMRVSAEVGCGDLNRRPPARQSDVLPTRPRRPTTLKFTSKVFHDLSIIQKGQYCQLRFGCEI